MSTTTTRRTPSLHPRAIAPHRRGLVLAWLAFTVTFAAVRALTYAIHEGVTGVGDVSAGGIHLHHYLWGILLVTGDAAFALVGQPTRRRTWMGLAFGIGLALIVDEFSLLLTLKDVYWTSRGRWSIDLALALIGIGGTWLTARRSMRDDRGDG